MTRKVSVHLEERLLKEPFKITGHVFTSHKSLVVEIKDAKHIGRGESAGVYYLDDTPETAMDQASALAADIKAGLDRDTLQNVLPAGGARNAIDCALWDLECKLEGKTIWQKTDISPAPQLTANTIGILETPDDMANAAAALSDFPLLKIKLDDDRPIERIRAIRQARPDARLFVDANQGFDFPLLLECLPEFAKCRIEMVEQPLPRGGDSELDGFTSEIPLCADESCLHRGELSQAAARYQMINIKLDKTGGLTEALALAKEGKALDVDLMVGNMSGTSLAMAPAFVIAQMCKLVDLDGPFSFNSDRLDGIDYNGSEVRPFNSGFWG